MAERETGVVRWFNEVKGFGRIDIAGGGDVYVHFSAIRAEGYRALDEGEKVEFTLGYGSRGRQAEDIVVIE